MYLTISYVGHAESVEKSLALDSVYPSKLDITLMFELFGKSLGFDLHLAQIGSSLHSVNYIPF